MKKLLQLSGFVAVLLLLFYAGSLLADKQTLRNDVIRLHVVADSDSTEDQKLKLSVRDAVIAYVQNDIDILADAPEARNYLASKLPALEEVANKTLKGLGSTDKAKAYLTKEKFGVREYDTFSLPSGVYESLRIEIGNAAGKNWWCVIFPTLCLPTTQDGFTDTAIAAGFTDGLTNTLSDNDRYEVRFFLLDCIGKLENFFSFSS